MANLEKRIAALEKKADIGVRVSVRDMTDSRLLAELAALGVHVDSVMGEVSGGVLEMAQRVGLIRPVGQGRI